MKKSIFFHFFSLFFVLFRQNMSFRRSFFAKYEFLTGFFYSGVLKYFSSKFSSWEEIIHVGKNIQRAAGRCTAEFRYLSGYSDANFCWYRRCRSPSGCGHAMHLRLQPSPAPMAKKIAPRRRDFAVRFWTGQNKNFGTLSSETYHI